MKKNIRNIIALVLAVALLSSCSVQSGTEKTETTAQPTFTETPKTDENEEILEATATNGEELQTTEPEASDDIVILPTLEPTVSPNADSTDKITETADVTSILTGTPVSGATMNPSATQTAKATSKATAKITATPKATATPKVTAKPTATPKVTAKPTATPVPTPTPCCYTRSGNYIYFGSYPQSEVTDTALKAKLTALAGSTSSWTSYDYLIESVASDFMKYKDVTYDGNKYRAVFFTQYRPFCAHEVSSEQWSYQDEAGFSTNTIYWYKYEPIKWQILSESDGDAFLLSDMVLDAQNFSDSQPATNYAKSVIRSWLNNEFYNLAFNSAEKNSIKTTEVDNSAESGLLLESPYACENTYDKIFLISILESINTDYGFFDNPGITTTRVKKCTGYAASQGLSVRTENATSWWLRSPYDKVCDNVGKLIQSRMITYQGGTRIVQGAMTWPGVCPALHLAL